MRSFVRYATIFLAFFAALPALCIAADVSAPGAKGSVFTGTARLVGNGAAWSWVECDGKGTPARIGVTFTETALSGLPPDAPLSQFGSVEYVLSLPAGVDVPPFTHIVMNWEPHGHPPPGVYDVPHFDFHFYLIDPAERVKMTCEGPDGPRCSAKPDAKFIPAGYVMPPVPPVPRMGAHWIDPSSPEFNKKPFTMTFIYGSYDGGLAFVEPMAANAYLDTKPDASGAIKLPASYQRRGYYPTAYSIKYDPKRREYTVALEGLVPR